MTHYDLNIHIPWDELKEKLKEAHMELSDEDLDYQPGQKKELLERIGKKIGKDMQATKAWVESVAYNKGIAS